MVHEDLITSSIICLTIHAILESNLTLLSKIAKFQQYIVYSSKRNDISNTVHMAVRQI